MLNVPITPPRVAFIDERTGNVSREWYMFFLSLLQTQGGSSISLDDLQKGPSPITVDDVLALIPEDIPVVSGVLEQVAELNKRVSALSSVPSDSTTEQVAELRKQIQGIMQAPQQQSVSEPIARYQRTLSWLTIAH